LVAGVAAAFAVSLKFRLRLDESLDVLPIHGIAGLLGTLLVGLFGTATSLGRNGLFYGGGVSLLGDRALAVLCVGVYSFALTFGIAYVLRRTLGLRVSAEEEIVGLDLSLHEETAYELEASSGVLAVEDSER
jgi:ammonium transporter, Amt family